VIAELLVFAAAIAGDNAKAAASQRLAVPAEYQSNSESSTTSASDAEPRAPSAGSSHSPAAVVATSSPDTDGTCDTVSATMWFHCPEGATSFMNADDDIDSNSANDEDGKT